MLSRATASRILYAFGAIVADWIVCGAVMKVLAVMLIWALVVVIFAVVMTGKVETTLVGLVLLYVESPFEFFPPFLSPNLALLRSLALLSPLSDSSSSADEQASLCLWVRF